MAQLYRTCQHPQVAEINRRLVKGASSRALAAEYNLDDRGLRRHRDRHIPRMLRDAQDAVEMAEADQLLAELRELHETTRSIIRGALAVVEPDPDEVRLYAIRGWSAPKPKGPNNEDRVVALKAIEVGRRNIELLLSVANALDDRAETRRQQRLGCRSCLLR